MYAIERISTVCKDTPLFLPPLPPTHIQSDKVKRIPTKRTDIIWNTSDLI